MANNSNTSSHAKPAVKASGNGTNATQNLSKAALKKLEFELKLKKIHEKNPDSGQSTFGEKTQEFYMAVAKAQHWANHYLINDDIPDSVIPSEWDFRNIKDYDFTGPVRDQLECGSCYSLGFIQAVEGRLKLKYARKDVLPKLSTQFLL